MGCATPAEIDHGQGPVTDLTELLTLTRSSISLSAELPAAS
jgi:hypothetical protein